MIHSKRRTDLPFGRPGKYRIRVQGFLDEGWSDRLGGMAISTSGEGSQGQITMLVGQLRDQAELMGVLDTLYELHRSILTVEHLEAD